MNYIKKNDSICLTSNDKFDRALPLTQLIIDLHNCGETI